MPFHGPLTSRSILILIFVQIRLVQTIVAKGCSATIATPALALNLFGLLIAGIYWAVDPYGTNQ